MFQHINSLGSKEEDHRPREKAIGLKKRPLARIFDRSAKSGGRSALYLAGRP
ncbi:hypothetical protein HYC85_030314 [Camellia sinensis]|uniref:Uncharacterized protein n=1 Tax=Camellia sinensis TaxID=4442 RepID=A0A7J7G0D6_CAMSI|nr:hypothetical protein HYC85_030314 [Camellia sinensis]